MSPRPQTTLQRWCLATALATFATASTAAAQQGVFLDQNGLIAVQFETADPVDDWTLSTSTPGYTGTGQFQWDGPNLFNSPGAQGVFGFDFEVNTSATWFLSIRNRHENPDATEENDVWVRVDNGSWIKVFSNQAGSVGAWTWESRMDFGSQPPASYNLSAGVHRIEFSGRSFGFKMDRFHLHLSGHPDSFSTSVPESPRRFGDSYCVAAPNSSGQVSEIEAFGSPVASANDVTLRTEGLPNSVLGYYVTSLNQAYIVGAGGSSGNLCVGANTGRYAGNVLSSGGTGSVELTINTASIPQPMGAVAATEGETWHFQFWHRDSSGGMPTSNFSRGMRFTFD